jgi:hypothetical protein
MALLPLGLKPPEPLLQNIWPVLPRGWFLAKVERYFCPAGGGGVVETGKAFTIVPDALFRATRERKWTVDDEWA